MNYVEVVDDRVRLRRAIISVYDKSGLDRLVPQLARLCPQLSIYSTGGSYAALADILGPQGASRLVQISDYTGQPEMQGGLVKTLDFKIYLGLLSETYNPAHRRDLERGGAVEMDLVVVNLYPFAQTVARAGATPEQARANIDIGGPCLLRAAAKNFLRVAAVVDPADYDLLLAELADGRGGALSLAFRFRLAGKAFAYTAEYDRAIAGYLASCSEQAMAAAYTEIRPGTGP